MITGWLLERTVGPEIEPITLAELHSHLRIPTSVTDEDDLLTALITAGREWVEDYTGRVLVDQTWRLTINPETRLWTENGDRVSGYTYGYYDVEQVWWRAIDIPLRKSPVIAISSFASVGSTGTETAIDATTYELREGASKWPRLTMLNSTVSTVTTYRVVFRAGYSDQQSSPQQDRTVIPERYKQAMKLWIEATYDRDPTMMPLLLRTAQSLIEPERCNLSVA